MPLGGSVFGVLLGWGLAYNCFLHSPVKAQADLEKELFDPCLNAFPELGSISGGFPGVSDIGVGDIGGGIPLPSSEITPADICRQTCNGNGKCVANTPVIRNDSSLRAPGIPSLANLFHCQCARDDCSTCSFISPIIPPADAATIGCKCQGQPDSASCNEVCDGGVMCFYNPVPGTGPVLPVAAAISYCSCCSD